MSMPFDKPSPIRKPGLFITATDTGVGKTVVTCGIAAALHARGMRVSVCKPMASGCRREGGELVSDDGLAIQHFAASGQSMDTICPIRFEPPMAPGPAALQLQQGIDMERLWQALAMLDQQGDCVLIEGIGGLLVPLLPHDPKWTVLDLIRWLSLPVLVVTRAALGTLNHTAMTVQLLRRSGCHPVGLVINALGASADDASVASNRQWLERMNDLPVLAQLPDVAAQSIRPEAGRIPRAILQPLAEVHWDSLLGLTAGGAGRR